MVIGLERGGGVGGGGEEGQQLQVFPEQADGERGKEKENEGEDRHKTRGGRGGRGVRVRGRGRTRGENIVHVRWGCDSGLNPVAVVFLQVLNSS